MGYEREIPFWLGGLVRGPKAQGEIVGVRGVGLEVSGTLGTDRE